MRKLVIARIIGFAAIVVSAGLVILSLYTASIAIPLLIVAAVFDFAAIVLVRRT